MSRVVHYLGIMYAVMCGALWVGSYCLWCIIGSETCGAFWGVVIICDALWVLILVVHLLVVMFVVHSG